MTLASTYHYWFSIRPPHLPKTAIAVIFLIGWICVYLIFLAKNKQKLGSPTKSLWYSIENWAITNFCLSWFFTFCYYEAIPFFSAKYWLALWLIGNLIYGKFFCQRVKDLPARLAKIKAEQDFKKYIPKKAQ